MNSGHSHSGPGFSASFRLKKRASAGTRGALPLRPRRCRPWRCRDAICVLFYEQPGEKVGRWTSCIDGLMFAVKIGLQSTTLPSTLRGMDIGLCG